jgi:hypothetical protein
MTSVRKMPGLFEAYEGESLVLSQSKARGNRKRLLPTISQMMQDSNNVNSGLNEVLGVIAQVVGWEKPDPTTKWRQIGGNLPTVTLGRCPRHFRGEVVTSRGESR